VPDQSLIQLTGRKALKDAGLRAGVPTTDRGAPKRGDRSEAAVADVLRKGRAHGSGLDLSLELGDQSGMPRRFPVHRILEALKQLLQVRHPVFERLQTVELRLGLVARRLPAGFAGSADLPDPPEQPIAVADGHGFFPGRPSPQAGQRRSITASSAPAGQGSKYTR